MNSLTAYFAGVATVVGSIAVGFGSAMMMTDSPPTSRPPTKLEQHLASSTPSAATATPAAASSTVSAGSSSSGDPSPSTAAAEAVAQPVAPASTSVANVQSSPPSTIQPSAPTSTQPTSQSNGQPSQQDSQPSLAAQSRSDVQGERPPSSFARATDEDFKRYIQKRDRRRAKRHFRNDEEGNPPVAEIRQDQRESAPGAPSVVPSPSLPSNAPSTSTASVQRSQPDVAAQSHSSVQDARAADASARAVDREVKRDIQNRNRQWAKRHPRNQDEDDGSPVVQVQQGPRVTPFAFGDGVRSRPFFGLGGDDDDN
jgi:hypothetical protein